MPVAEGLAVAMPGVLRCWRLRCRGAGVLGGLARLRSAWPPPGLPWSWPGRWSRRITRAVTRLDCRDQGTVHDHGTL